MTFADVHHPARLEMLPAPLINIVHDENSHNARFTSVMACMSDLNALATLLRVEQATKGDALDEERMGLLVNAIAHRLLDQQSLGPPEPVTRCDIVSEALRLGAIIWIIGVKRRYRSYPATAGARISTLLKLLSSSLETENVWNSSPDLRIVGLWLLVVCSTSEAANQDHATSMRMIANHKKDQRPGSWDEVMSNIRRMPWIDMYEPSYAELRQELKEFYM